MKNSKYSEFHGKFNKILIAFKNTSTRAIENKNKHKNTHYEKTLINIKATEFDEVSPKLFAIYKFVPMGR